MRYLEITPLGDRAAVIKFAESIEEDAYRKVRTLAAHLEERPFAGMLEVVPSYTSVTVYYDPLLVQSSTISYRQRIRAGGYDYYERVKELLHSIVDDLDERFAPESRYIDIPVCYGGKYGPDLEEVAEVNRLSIDDVIRIHSSAEYLVYMLGFAPGFPYMGGMDMRIAAPRKATPRLMIPAGSVGIAGGQTGIYPIATPGGWNLIGRTPLSLFVPDEHPPTLLMPGDTVRFQPITQEEYRRLEGEL